MEEVPSGSGEVSGGHAKVHSLFVNGSTKERVKLRRKIREEFRTHLMDGRNYLGLTTFEEGYCLDRVETPGHWIKLEIERVL